MLREDTVFGPIYSRRLGNSLGINLLPREGKICNFDCIYCECGWNEDGRGDSRIPNADEVRSRLEAKLQELAAAGTVVDSITFSGDGEPTINPDFPQIIDDTIELRDRYLPSARVSVLSNATRVHEEAIFNALRKVDMPILKIDAPTDEGVRIINRPAPGYSLKRTVAALERFEGNFVLQTMFLKAPDFDSSDPVQLSAWMELVRKLKPRMVMVYTIARPTPAKGLSKFSVDEMKRLVAPLLDEGYDIQISG